MIFYFIFSLVFSNCGPWNGPHLQGSLDSHYLDEASGLVIYQDTMYHINDSGDGPYIYSTKLDGSSTKQYKLENAVLFDQEGLSLSTCGKDPCLVIGDIGDNLRLRENIDFYFVKIKDLNSNGTKVFHHLRVRYPDQARNAEGFAFDKAGNLVLITKEGFDLKKKSENAIVYKLDRQYLQSKKMQTFSYIDRLPIKNWLPKKGWLAQIVTDFYIAEDIWYLLTYDYIIVLRASPKIEKEKWLCKIVPFSRKTMKQAEAFYRYKDKLYMTTEKRKSTKKQWIMTWSLEAESKEQ